MARRCALAPALLFAPGGARAVSLVEHEYGPGHDQLDDGFPYVPAEHVPPTDPTFAEGYRLAGAAAESGARCLDGSPPMYYHRKGTGDGADKWFVWQEGGAWCTSVASCAQRALGSLGSTAGDPQNRSLRGGYFDTNSSVNPLMHNWNAVYLRYCDGASVAGDAAAPVQYGNQTLYFRGRSILDAEIASLLHDRGMANATGVVIGGCSAGGLAAYLHCDKWAAAVAAASGGRAATRCLPDSGFFINDIAKVRGRLQGAYRTQSCATGVHPACIATYNVTGDDWKCMYAQWTAPFIQTPTFGLQSRYDSWQMGGYDAADVNALGANITALVASQLLASAANGVFLDACSHHCGSSGPQPAWGSAAARGSTVDGVSMGEAVRAWYERGSGGLANSGFYDQDRSYPCADCCTSE